MDFFAREPDQYNRLAHTLTDNKNSLAEKEETWLELEILREEIDANKIDKNG